MSSTDMRGGQGVKKIRAERLIYLYYLATPLFAMLDGVMGVDVRAAFLDDIGNRYGWYLACFVLGLVTWRWPVSAPFVALFESAANILFLCLSVMLPMYQIADVDPHAIPEEVGLSGYRLLGFVLASTVCLISFKSAQAQLARMSKQSL